MDIDVLRSTASKPIFIAIRFVILACLFFAPTSCYGPYYNTGYNVSIHIDKNASPTTNDVALITDYLDESIRDDVVIKGENSWKMESYKIKLNEKEFKELGHRYVMFVVAYTFTNQSVKNQILLERIDIRIGNSWEGRIPILKKKIDSVADHIIIKLKKRFGESNFTVERNFVAPI